MHTIPPNWPFIKVCGIQTPDEAAMALSSGANTIGLLVGLLHKADDELGAEEAKFICQKTRLQFPGARVALVTHLFDPKMIKDLVAFVGVTSVQLHNDIRPENVEQLRSALPNSELFKTVHIEKDDDAIQSLIAYARQYENVVDGFLTDSKYIDSDGKLRIGGTGQRHSTTAGAALVKAFPHKPIILAGGLNDQNVAEAIREILPAGIDANSGLENLDGSKNAEKIRQFALAGKLCPYPTSI